MAIFHSVTPYYDQPEVIALSQDGDRVEFRLTPKGWHYVSMRAGETSWTHSTMPPAPLETLWHHAMVFFGVVDPDDVSHPHPHGWKSTDG